MKYKKVFFDLDGVLVDSEPVNIRAMQKTFSDRGLVLSQAEIEMIPGRSSRLTIPQFLSVRGVPANQHQAIVEANLRNYDALWDIKIKLMPDAEMVVRLLHARGVVLAIGTTNRRIVAEKFIRKFGFDGVFLCVVAGDTVKKMKPDPEVWLQIMRQLDCSLGEALAVEDTGVGVLSVKNAGLACAAIPNEYSKHHDFSGADYILSSLKGILDLI